MTRIAAVLFGIAFIFAGVAGFFPSFMPNGLLLGYFSVDSMHNMFHIATGVIAIMCSLSRSAAKSYFIIFGFIYAVIAVAGFSGMYQMPGMQMNTADNILHVFVAAIALYLGFSAHGKRA